MDIKEVEIWHPKLVGKNYKIINTTYDLTLFNCIAYSIDNYYDWHGSTTTSWPYDKIGSRIPSVENYIKFFNLYNFKICNNEGYDEGFDKIAIYTDQKNFVTHAAKQYGNMWRSKLGQSVILEHELDWIAGYDFDNYGKVHAIMKKPK